MAQLVEREAAWKAGASSLALFVCALLTACGLIDDGDRAAQQEIRSDLTESCHQVRSALSAIDRLDIAEARDRVDAAVAIGPQRHDLDRASRRLSRLPASVRLGDPDLEPVMESLRRDLRACSS